MPGQFLALNSPARAAANLALAGLWLWLYRPVFDYLGVIFGREDFRTNQIVLAAALVLIALRLNAERNERRARGDGLRLRLDAPPRPAALPLLFLLGGSLAFLAVERYLDINTVSASLFALSGYGLLGLWLPAARWRQGLPAALLIVGALPFGDHLQTFAGYPMRVAAATIVRDGLAAAGVASAGVDTILVFENGISQVDLPCSGIKSLWTGGLFLLAATWIEARPFNRRWFVTALVFAGLLFAANVARVGLLVLLGQVAGWTFAARMLHVPLGVLGFAASCAAAAVLLRGGASHVGQFAKLPGLPLGNSANCPTTGAFDRSADRTQFAKLPGLPLGNSANCPTSGAFNSGALLAPALAAGLLVMSLVYAPRPYTGLVGSPPDWQFPAQLATQRAPLSPVEVEWLTRGGAESADRRRFTWGDLSGSVILVPSTSWRGQHRPERCLEVYGLTIDNSETRVTAAGFPVRAVSLSDRTGRRVLSAAYWFQAAGRTTDDAGTRMWADLAPERERWVLVSILFDDAQDLEAAGAQALFAALHAAVAQYLEGGIEP